MFCSVVFAKYVVHRKEHFPLTMERKLYIKKYFRFATKTLLAAQKRNVGVSIQTIQERHLVKRWSLQGGNVGQVPVMTINFWINPKDLLLWLFVMWVIIILYRGYSWLVCWLVALRWPGLCALFLGDFGYNLLKFLQHNLFETLQTLTILQLTIKTN